MADYAANSKVTKFAAKAGIKKDIGGLQITMNDAVRLNGMKISKNRVEPFGNAYSSLP